MPNRSDNKLVPIVGRGIYAAECRGEPALKVTYVVVDENAVTYSLADGRTVSAPLKWYPRLQYATPRERNDWRVILGGRAVSWRPLRLAIAAKALLEGTRASESPLALKKWLSERNRVPHRKAG